MGQAAGHVVRESRPDATQSSPRAIFDQRPVAHAWAGFGGRESRCGAVRVQPGAALDALVESGELPPVAERLPKEPLVQEVVEEIGTYGGTLRRGFLGPSDHNNYTRVVYDALARYSPDGTEVIPHIAKGWELNDDFSQWQVFLREGMKWSDGAPFTADDILFWYEHIVLNSDLSPTVPIWMQNKDGSAARSRSWTTARCSGPTRSPTPRSC